MAKTKAKDEEEQTEESGSADEDSKGKKSEEKDDLPWDEYNRLKREASERAKKDREDERKRKRDEGKHQEVADAEKKRADEAEARADKLERERLVERVASNAGLEFPEDAPKYLTDEEMSDERSAEAALRKLKERRPKLFVEKKRSGADIEDVEEEESETETAKTGGTFGLDRLRGVKRKNT
jgi:hypothetical protein